MRPPVGKSWQDYKNNWYVADGFGVYRGSYYHSGLDINLKTGGDSDLGQPLYAVLPGKVVYYHKNSHPTSSYGKHCVLECDTPKGKRWFHYAHTQDFKTGSFNEGDQIGALGKSGTKYAHLHFTVFKVDPKTLPKGIDTVIKTKQQLADWLEDPSVWLKEDSMASGNISIPTAKFEELVGKADKLDQIRTTIGTDSATEIKNDYEEYKKTIMQKNEEIKNERERADLARKELNTLIKEASMALNTVQEPTQIIAALKKVKPDLDRVEDLERTVAELQLSAGKEKEELLNEIARLKALVEHGDVSQLTLEELIREIIKRLKNIVRRTS